MGKSTFVYVTYIRAAPEDLWAALTDGRAMKRYWLGVHCESRWTPGSPWRLVYPDGRVTDTGVIEEALPPKRLAIRWRHRAKPELEAEGESRCVMEAAAGGPALRLTLTHTIGREPSLFIAAISVAWPMVMSNLKSLLETGDVVLRETFHAETR